MVRIDRTDRRPLPGDWNFDDPMTLSEFVRVFGHKYPVTVSGLRTAIARGELTASKVGGRLFVTPGWVADLFAPRPLPKR